MSLIYIFLITNKNFHDQCIYMKIYKITYDIPTNEGGQTRGGKDHYYDFLSNIKIL